MNGFISDTWAFWGLLGIAIILTVVAVAPAYAQVDEQIIGFVEEGVEDAINELTADLDFTQGNPLNTTSEEAENLKESGQEMLSVTIDMVKASHSFSEDLILFFSPFDIPSIILTIIAGAIAVVFLLSLLKRLAIHIMIFTVIALLVGMLLIWFYS